MPVHPIIAVSVKQPLAVGWTPESAAKLRELQSRRGTQNFKPTDEQLYQRLSLLKEVSNPIPLMDSLEPREFVLCA